MEKNMDLPKGGRKEEAFARSFQVADAFLRHPCKGCFHWRGESFGSICCNYIFDVGHRRPCPAGEGCTVRKERGPAELKKLRDIQKLR